MLTTTQAAAQLGLCQSRIRQLCLTGKLPGAYKMGRDWVIPENSIAQLNPKNEGVSNVPCLHQSSQD